MGKHKAGFNRRQFLKLVGAGLGAAVASPLISGLAKTPVSYPAARSLAQTRTGVIHVAWDPPKNLDPAFIANDAEIAFCNAIYDYLIDPTMTDKLAPRLAKSWTVSDDGLQYTFNLVENVKFHDGKALTAADVIFSFNRLRDEKIGSPKLSLYKNVKDIKAVNDLTVVFVLEHTEPDFLYNIADSSALIVPDGSTKLDTVFNGTGPFKLDRYLPEDRAVFVANENYWIPGLPRLAGMEHIYMDANAAVEALRGGSIDVVLRMSNARFIALQQDDTLQTVSFPTSGHDVLRLRVDMEPGNKPDVQRALKMATDRKKINEVAQLGLGGEGRDAPIGPYFADYFLPDSPLPPYDPEGAKKLLAGAGYPNGLTLDVHVPNSGTRPDFATVIKDQWAKAGVTINIVLEDEATYYSATAWLDAQLGMTGWGARPTPQQYLELALKSTSQWNETRIKDPELDKLIDTAGTSMNRDERIQAYKQIQVLLAERGPLIIPYFFPITGAVRKAFTFEDGFQPFTGRTDFRRAAQAK